MKVATHCRHLPRWLVTEGGSTEMGSELLTWRKLRKTKFPLFQVRSAECGVRN
jgi:hypothetical protein